MDRELGIKKIVSFAAGGRQLLPKGVILEAGSPKFLRTIKRNLDGPFFVYGRIYPPVTALTKPVILVDEGPGGYLIGLGRRYARPLKPL